MRQDGKMSDYVNTSRLPSAVDGIAEACAAGDAQGLFAAVDEWVGAVLRQTLCTVNRYEPSRERLTRLYSSDPASYPVGSSKDKSGTSWGRHVLHERRIFIGEGTDAIRQAFDDHKTIQALGLKSVINVPIVAQDSCMGTLNLLMRSEAIDDAMVQWAKLAALLATPGFLFLRTAAQ